MICANDDRAALAQHLAAGFPELPDSVVFVQLSRAKAAVEEFGLPDGEGLALAEQLTRHQLRIAAGHVPDAARLDPEVHVRPR